METLWGFQFGAFIQTHLFSPSAIYIIYIIFHISNQLSCPYQTDYNIYLSLYILPKNVIYHYAYGIIELSWTLQMSIQTSKMSLQ